MYLFLIFSAIMCLKRNKLCMKEICNCLVKLLISIVKMEFTENVNDRDHRTIALERTTVVVVVWVCNGHKYVIAH